MKLSRPLVLFVVLLCVSLPAAVAFAASSPESEPNGDAASANRVALEGRCFASETASINPGGDLDFFSFGAHTGEQAWISVDSGGAQGPGATSRDTKLQLLAPNGSLIEEDDDDGTANGGDGSIESGLSSIIGGRILPTDGTYDATVNAFSGTEVVNPYRLFVATTSAGTTEQEPNGSQSLANPVPNCRTPLSGAITPAGDKDLYSFHLDQGQAVFIDADADPERDGGTDLVLELLSPIGEKVIEADSSISTVGVAEGFDFNAPVAGTYFLVVRHFSVSGTGNYRILISPDDVTAPTTTIGSAPAALSASRKQAISFSGADDVSGGSSLRFECALTKAGGSPAFAPCAGAGSDSRTAPSDGRYAYAVRAVDATGNADASPATASVTIDTAKPKLQRVKVRVDAARRTATLSFKATDATALKFQCKLDKSAFRNCTKPKKRKFTNLAAGRHKLKLKATDAVGHATLVVKSFQLG